MNEITTPAGENAVAAVQPKPMGLVPTTMGGMYKLAETLAKAEIVPKALQSKPTNVLVVLLTGQELGLSPMQSIRGIDVIEGKGAVSAQTLMGLCVSRREVCEYFTLTHTDPKKATYKTKRVGSPEPVELSYTIEEATLAGLTAKDNWKRNPADMLRNRTCSKLARAVYPDLCQGIYTVEEAQEIASAMHAESEVIDEPDTRTTTERVKAQLKARTGEAKTAESVPHGFIRRADGALIADPEDPRVRVADRDVVDREKPPGAHEGDLA